MSEKKIIRYETAAETYFLSEASGWLCKTCNSYYGKEKHKAQWCCATDLPCGTEGCDNRTTKPYAMCESCRAEENTETMNSLLLEIHAAVVGTKGRKK